ncbi:MAG: glutaredoxin domain-containing protein [Patescibacteria group bacterium]|nr:glutaredoxin domain-containing protein [Patescibacteria group bacterium]
MKLSKYTIYSTPTCHYCHLLKDWLKENHVAFEEKDVASDVEARQEMVAKSHQLGVPVSIVQLDDSGTMREEIVIGFDQMRLGQLLDIG